MYRSEIRGKGAAERGGPCHCFSDILLAVFCHREAQCSEASPNMKNEGMKSTLETGAICGGTQGERELWLLSADVSGDWALRWCVQSSEIILNINWGKLQRKGSREL